MELRECRGELSRESALFANQKLLRDVAIAHARLPRHAGRRYRYRIGIGIGIQLSTTVCKPYVSTL